MRPISTTQKIRQVKARKSKADLAKAKDRKFGIGIRQGTEPILMEAEIERAREIMGYTKRMIEMAKKEPIFKQSKLLEGHGDYLASLTERPLIKRAIRSGKLNVSELEDILETAKTFNLAVRAGVTVAMVEGGKNKPKGERQRTSKAKVAGTKVRTPNREDMWAMAKAQPTSTYIQPETLGSLHNGLVGMAERVQAPMWLQDKIVLMDRSKLEMLYNEDPSYFSVVFSYEEIGYDPDFGGWNVDAYEMDRLYNFVSMYEKRFGEL